MKSKIEFKWKHVSWIGVLASLWLPFIVADYIGIQGDSAYIVPYGITTLIVWVVFAVACIITWGEDI